MLAKLVPVKTGSEHLTRVLRFPLTLRHFDKLSVSKLRTSAEMTQSRLSFPNVSASGAIAFCAVFNMAPRAISMGNLTKVKVRCPLEIRGHDISFILLFVIPEYFYGE